MPLHSIGSGTISFGLVSIPVKMFSAASSSGVSFNQLHQKCGGRLRQQLICPTCNEVVERTALVKGYEFAKDQYVQFTEDELKTLEGEASQDDRHRRVRSARQVDPIYFEKTYYLGPDKGGEKAYRLLTDAMVKAERVALAKFVMRGKENLVLIRAAQDGLMLHTMYFADEIRDFGEVDKGDDAKLKPGELELAERLVGGAVERAVPSGAVRRRVSDARARGRRVQGRRQRSDVAGAAGAAHAGDRPDGRAQAEPREARRGGDGAAARRRALEKKPAARAREKAEPAPREKKAQGGKR